jgi:cell division transport system ATP-binding protein
MSSFVAVRGIPDPAAFLPSRPETGRSVIRLYDVCRRYGELWALQNVTVKIPKGEFCYVTGPSGAGKTTLLRLIYAADRPTEGKIVIGNLEVDKLPRRRIPFLRRNIGVIFQDFKLIPARTVGANVALALEVLGYPTDLVRRRVSAILNTVGLHGREDDFPTMLSGGEQQRVAVARAIVNDPAILLADEPTGNLDGAMAIEVVEILQAVNLRGTTVVVATHDMALMERFPYRRLRFERGRLVREFACRR